MKDPTLFRFADLSSWCMYTVFILYAACVENWALFAFVMAGMIALRFHIDRLKLMMRVRVDVVRKQIAEGVTKEGIEDAAG